jgi:phage FluMu protein Com
MKIYILPANYIQEPVVREGKNRFVCVFLSPIITEEVRNFRCLECGWVCFQYTNKEVDSLVYGLAKPKETNSIDSMCPRCKIIYRIV